MEKELSTLLMEAERFEYCCFANSQSCGSLAFLGKVEFVHPRCQDWASEFKEPKLGSLDIVSLAVKQFSE